MPSRRSLRKYGEDRITKRPARAPIRFSHLHKRQLTIGYCFARAAAAANSDSLSSSRSQVHVRSSGSTISAASNDRTWKVSAARHPSASPSSASGASLSFTPDESPAGLPVSSLKPPPLPPRDVYHYLDNPGYHPGHMFSLGIVFDEDPSLPRLPAEEYIEPFSIGEPKYPGLISPERLQTHKTVWCFDRRLGFDYEKFVVDKRDGILGEMEEHYRGWEAEYDEKEILERERRAVVRLLGYLREAVEEAVEKRWKPHNERGERIRAAWGQK